MFIFLLLGHIIQDDFFLVLSIEFDLLLLYVAFFAFVFIRNRGL